MIDLLFNQSIAWSLALQQVGAGFTILMRAFSELGTSDFYTLAMPLIYWTMDTSLGLRLGLLLMTSAGLNNIFKWALHLPRPFWVAPAVQGQWLEPTFGAPSGHAQHSLSLLSLAGFHVKRAWFWALAALLVFAIGLSRIALGVHFTFDVLLGWVLGQALVLAFLRYEKPIADWIREKAFAQQALLVFSASIIMILLGTLTVGWADNFQVPVEWEVNAVADVGEPLNEVFDLKEIITPAGALFGFGLGYLWMESRGGFSTKGRARDFVLRIIVGVIGAVLFQMGLGAIFPREQDVLSYSLRYLRYALVGVWVTGGAPWLFIRMGWAQGK